MAYRKKNDVTIEICMGLPGSGKTTWAKSRENRHTRVYHIDQMMDLKYHDYELRNKSKRSLYDGIVHNMHYIEKGVKTVVLDGLFLTNGDVSDMICAICDCFNEIKLDIHWWKEDRETCVKNDGGRREVSSVTTILHAPYEYPDKELLDSVLNEVGVSVNKIVEHEVFLKEDWKRFFRGKMYLSEDGMLKGQRWSGGGSYGTCWHNGLTPVSAEEPRNFDELDSLLEEICPNISFLHYKKIQSNCVTMEDYYDRDYYGGGITYHYWQCDLKKLYEALNDLGYDVTPA